MDKTIKLPEIIPVFPLSNFIFFPKTTVPLNIFEKRYIEMVDDAMSSDKIIGMVQPKESNQNSPLLHKVGCVGKINSFNEMDDGKYMKRTVPEIINGQYVLVDESGDIYSPIISEQRRILVQGLMSKSLLVKCV